MVKYPMAKNLYIPESICYTKQEIKKLIKLVICSPV